MRLRTDTAHDVVVVRTEGIHVVSVDTDGVSPLRVGCFSELVDESPCQLHGGSAPPTRVVLQIRLSTLSKEYYLN